MRKQQLLILLALFAVGCAAATPERKGKQRPKVVSFQCDPDDEELWNAAARAADAWSYALGARVLVAQDGEIPIFRVPDVYAEPGCEPPPDQAEGAWAGACSPGAGTPDVHIVVAENAPDMSRIYAWMLHEMGHVLGGRGGHLPEGTKGVLTQYNTGETEPLLTRADVEYVCTSPNRIIECPGPLGRLSASA